MSRLDLEPQNMQLRYIKRRNKYGNYDLILQQYISYFYVENEDGNGATGYGGGWEDVPTEEE